MGSPEAVVESHLVRKARGAGILVYKLEFINTSGAPDRLLCCHGRCVLAECKRLKGGVLSSRQKIVHWMLGCVGVRVALVDSVEKADRLVDSMTSTYGITVTEDECAALATGGGPLAQRAREALTSDYHVDNPRLGDTQRALRHHMSGRGEEQS